MGKVEAIAVLLLTLFMAGAIVAGMLAIVSTALGPYGIKLTLNLFVKITLWASVCILTVSYFMNLFGA